MGEGRIKQINKESSTELLISLWTHHHIYGWALLSPPHSQPIREPDAVFSAVLAN